MNNLLRTDSYKMSHFMMYPKDITEVYAYIEPRKLNEEIVFYGISDFIKTYLAQPFFNQDDIEHAAEVCEKHRVPFNAVGWEYLLTKYGGYLPLEICAVPEGSVLPSSNPLVTIRNTDENVPWLPTWLETILLRAIWYPTTIASNGRKIKKLLHHYYSKTGSTSDLRFKLHDFGARGVSSGESARIGGRAHLIHFTGSDTLEAAELDGNVISSSIPAAEHSTIMTHLNEFMAYNHILEQFPTGPVAIVADTYDIYNAVCNIFGRMLFSKIYYNDNRCVIIRPDSGTPWTIVPTVIQMLADKFDVTKNDKGYYVLPANVRVVQGDGINYDSIEKICKACEEQELSLDNIAAFGMGSKLLQEVSRDDYNFAMKVSNIVKQGVSVPVYKQPKTDASKASKFGKFSGYRLEPVYTHEIPNVNPAIRYSKFPDVIDRANKDFGENNV